MCGRISTAGVWLAISLISLDFLIEFGVEISMPDYLVSIRIVIAADKVTGKIDGKVTGKVDKAR